MERKIDELDTNIIRLLSKDGRMSFTEISNRLEVTEKTVRTRYKSLIEDDIIDIVGVVNPISLGLNVSAIVQISAGANYLEKIIQQTRKYKEVRYISLITGEYQLYLQVNVKDYQELTSFIKQLNLIEGVTKCNTMVQLEVNKNSHEII
ncbi:Lrp/AsnC family transcriptional regulator [Bacillus sp. FJAT-45350]|uniref:Lrp/AsnC family transcriptional regulator n=1 Tax=Bacillus sp. FJAT-45350 TaxID=2011014 RepID=UPI000BB94D57|nr:Lrp/AsnC family transcriptional regulator [Bacillus sp. FJAT-45350]